MKSGLIALLIAGSVSAAAAPPPPRMPWLAAVEGPRPGLPAVAVEIGYPGPYVPSVNTPVALRMTATDVGFDGYIGFSFAVQERRTIDAPVVTRVKLGPHQSRTFRTFATVRRRAGTPWDVAVQPREFVVEWRNAALKVIANRSAGVPPWTYTGGLQALVIAPASVRGGYVAQPGELSARGQWYAGFESVIVPLATWLDLPADVRGAIFGAGIQVTFIGFARPGQQLDRATRALLPVVFAPQAGSYRITWPYGSSSVATPLSWTAKPTIGYVGSPQNPYIARSATAAWVADENALTRPLPSLLRTGERFVTTDIAGPPESHRTAWMIAIAFVLGILAWLMIVRSRPAFAAALLAIFVVGVAAAHNRIRAKARVVEQVMRGTLAPGVALDVRQFRAWGPTPLGPVRADRFVVTGDLGFNGVVEIRTADTPPSMGLLEKVDDYDSAIRWIVRRQVAADDAVDRIVVPSANDLHDGIRFWAARPAAASGPYVVRGDIRTLTDGRMQSTFALAPPGSEVRHSATIQVSAVLAAHPLELRWAAGSLQLPVSKPAVGRDPSGVIPSEAMQSILDSGGVFDVIATPDRQVVQRFFRISLAVQERKS